MDYRRLIELMPYNLAHRTRLAASVERHLAAGKKLYEAFAASGLVTVDKLANGLAAHYNLPRWDYHEADPVQEGLPDLLPASIAKRFAIAPIRVVLDRLALAVVDPTAVDVFDEIRRVTGHEVRVCVATPADIEAMQGRLYGSMTLVGNRDRRWTSRLGVVESAGKKLLPTISIDLLHGIEMPPVTPYWIVEDAKPVDAAKPPEMLVFNSKASDIENIYEYSLEEMPNLAPEDDKKR